MEVLKRIEAEKKGTASRPSFSKICLGLKVSPADLNEYVYKTLGFEAEELLYPRETLDASSRNARLSGPEPSADGSPASPPSRMPCTSGICDSSSNPSEDAIAEPPSLPKI